MKGAILSLEKKNMIVRTQGVVKSELLAIAKGMKKDGYSEEEISKQTNLPITVVRNLGEKKGKLPCV